MFSAPPAFTTRPDLEGTFGAVASTHWLATATGMGVLERGGNAFDAAVATGFVLQVVEPHLNGPGGDLVGLVRPAGAAPRVLMGQGPAPAAATREHYADEEGLDLVPGSGALAAAVPGAVDAWLLLLAEHGTWELADVLAPAIGYARDGAPLLPSAARTIAGVADLFRDAWPTSAARWLHADGTPPEAHEIVTNPELADVYERLVAAGGASGDRGQRIEAARRAWAETVGPAAEAAALVPHRHSDGRDHAGVLTAADLRAFRASFEAPVALRFRGRTVVKAGFWSSGPVLLQTLALLEPLPDGRLDPGTGEGAHTVLAALDLALADREAWYGDHDSPLDHLLASAYSIERRALLGDDASSAFRPGPSPFSLPPLVAERLDAVDATTGEPTVAPPVDLTDAEEAGRGDTCHLDVADRAGNVVSITPSGGWLQSSPTIPGLGFCLGTRLQMTWLEPGTATTLTPGRRPRTTLSPTLVLEDGGAVLALGTPGGDQQDQWQLPVLLRVLVGGWSLQQAIDAPTLHSTAFPGSFWPRRWDPAGAVVEDRLGDAVIDDLTARGHRVTRAGDWALGRVSAVRHDPARGTVQAAANPRGMQGYAIAR